MAGFVLTGPNAKVSITEFMCRNKETVMQNVQLRLVQQIKKNREDGILCAPLSILCGSLKKPG